MIYQNLARLKTQRLNRIRTQGVSYTPEQIISPAIIEAWWDNKGDPYTLLDNRTQKAWYMRTATMEDEYSDAPKPWPMRPCNHTVIERSCPERMGTTSWSDCRGHAGHYVYDKDYTPALDPLREAFSEPAIISSMIPYGDLTDDQVDYLRNTLEHIIPDLKPDMNVASFIAELRDVKSLFTSIKDVCGNVLKVLPSLKHIFTSSTPKGVALAAVNAVKHTGDAAAGANLAWLFGWKPFLSDLKELVDVCTTLSDRIETLYNGEGKVHRQTRSRDFGTLDGTSVLTDHYPVDICAVDGGCPEGPAAVSRVYKCEVESKIGLTVVYRYTCPPLEALETKISALIEGLGMSDLTLMLWEVFPFSWLIDWIVDIQGLLEELVSSDLFRVETEIIDIAISRRSKTQINVFWQECGTGGERFLHRATVSQYQRYAGAACLDVVDPDIFDLLRERFTKFNFKLSGTRIGILASLGWAFKSKKVSSDLNKLIRKL